MTQLIPENITIERIWILSKVEFKSRYYYHKLGLIWALIKPVTELLIYFVVFNTLFESDLEKFVLYLFSGLTFWYFFSECTKRSIKILIEKLYLIESVPFNKINIVMASLISCLLGLSFNMLAYLIISIFFKSFPDLFGLVQTFALVINLSLLTLGVGLILASFSIYLKDIEHLWDMILMAGFWATPIVYDQKLLVENIPWMLYFNPLVPLLSLLREAIVYDLSLSIGLYCLSLFQSISVFIIGLLFFNNLSHKVAEKL